MPNIDGETVGRQRKAWEDEINPFNAELNPICHLLALLGAHHILHVSRIRVKTSCDVSVLVQGCEGRFTAT